MRLYLRTEKEKADPDGWWRQSDERFFAAGACHVLAGAFLHTYAELDFHSLLIQPRPGLRGTHVLATNGSLAFDARGWAPLDDFLHRYARAHRAIAPAWRCATHYIGDPMGWDFCLKHGSRHPTQFPQDPVARARRFLDLIAFPPNIT